MAGYSTLANVFANARFRTGVSSSDFGDSSTDLITIANKYYRKVIMALVGNNEDWYASISSLGLSDGGNPYNLSSDSSLSGGGNIKILRLEVSYDNGTSFVVATPLDYEQITTPTILEADVDNSFSSSEPFYAVYNNQLYLFPDVDTTSYAKVFEVTRQKELTASTNVFTDKVGTGDFQLPKEFMEDIEDGIVIELNERLGRMTPQEARNERNAWEATVKNRANKFSHRNEDLDLNVAVVSDYQE